MPGVALWRIAAGSVSGGIGRGTREVVRRGNKNGEGLLRVYVFQSAERRVLTFYTPGGLMFILRGRFHNLQSTQTFPPLRYPNPDLLPEKLQDVHISISPEYQTSYPLVLPSISLAPPSASIQTISLPLPSLNPNPVIVNAMAMAMAEKKPGFFWNGIPPPAGHLPPAPSHSHLVGKSKTLRSLLRVSTPPELRIQPRRGDLRSLPGPKVRARSTLLFLFLALVISSM